MSTLIPIIGYLLLSVLISRYLGRRFSDGLHDDKAKRFFIGGRFLNGPLLALTLVATYTSASSFIGGPGAAYHIGLGWVWLALIQVPVAMLTMGVLGPKFLALKTQHTTLIEWLDARFNHPWLSRLAILSLVTGFIAMITVQFIGGARLFAGVSGISYQVGLIIFVLTVLAYTLTGGFRAVTTTDAVQGVIMLLGVLMLLFAILSRPDFTEKLGQLADHQPFLFAPMGDGQNLGWPMMLSFWVLICFGTMGLPHTVVRLLAVKDNKALKQGIIWGTLISFLMTLIPHLCGFFGRALYPDLAVPDKIMPTLIGGLFSPWVAGVFLAAPIAAVMSSVDSMLLQSAVTFIRDAWVREAVLKGKAEMPAHHQLILTRLAMLLISALAFWWALEPPKMIVWLNLAAFGALQAVFLWPVIAGLFIPWISGRAAFAAMLSGLVSYLLVLSYGPLPDRVHPIVPTLVLSALIMLLITLVERRKTLKTTKLCD